MSGVGPIHPYDFWRLASPFEGEEEPPEQEDDQEADQEDLPCE